jgi:hypothetical protein
MSSPKNNLDDNDLNQSEKRSQDWEGNLEKISSISNNTNNLNIHAGPSKMAPDSKYAGY